MRRLLSATAIAMATVSIVPLSVGGAFGGSAVAQNQSDEDRRRNSQTLRQGTARELGNAINALNADPPNLQEALNILNRLASQDIPPFDLSTVLEIRGATNFQLGNENAAIRDFVRVLEIDALPSDRLKQIRYNVAQLYFQQENYDLAIRFMREYLSDEANVQDPNAWYILAAAYVSKNDYRSARRPGERVIQYDTKKEKKNFLLLNLIYSELNLHTERARLLEQMIELFPEEESLWAQLSGVYAILDRQRDAFATLEVAYKAGLIRDEAKIVVLAQYYSELDNPFRGAKLLEQEMAAGTVKRNLKNLRLLGQLWSMAREQPRAIAALTEAAKIDDSGELFYRIGQGYMADEKFREALRNFDLAVQKGGLTTQQRGDIALLRGNALFSLDSETPAGRARARAAFVQATRYDRTRRAAQGWVDYIDAIEETLRIQDEVEQAQREAERERQIKRCEALIDVWELLNEGNAAEAVAAGSIDDEQLIGCVNFLAQVEAGEEAVEEDDASAEQGEEAADTSPDAEQDTAEE